MAFQMNGGNFSINGVPIGKVDKIEVAKAEQPEPCDCCTPKPTTFECEIQIDTIAECVWDSIVDSLNIPPAWFKPDWASRAIRIPERRIRQILGE